MPVLAEDPVRRGVSNILLCDIERPGLVVALALRGIAVGEVTDRDAAAVLASVFGACVASSLFACPGRLVVLARDEAAAIAALDGGADDAIVASAGDGLIAARLARIIERDTIRVGDLVIDIAARVAALGGYALALLPREYALLVHFVRAAGCVVTRADLRETVWGFDFDPGTNVIEVHVSRLRAKLAAAGAGPVLLTEKGRGYRLIDAAPIAAEEIAL